MGWLLDAAVLGREEAAVEVRSGAVGVSISMVTFSNMPYDSRFYTASKGVDRAQCGGEYAAECSACDSATSELWLCVLCCLR